MLRGSLIPPAPSNHNQVDNLFYWHFIISLCFVVASAMSRREKEEKEKRKKELAEEKKRKKEAEEELKRKRIEEEKLRTWRNNLTRVSALVILIRTPE
jgi:uncharacterized protein YlxW (UPF0749 family)